MRHSPEQRGRGSAPRPAAVPGQVAAGVAEHEPENRYRFLVEKMARAFCLIEKVATAPGQPSDYRYVAVNAAFTRHSGLPGVVGQTLRAAVPGVEQHIVDLYDEVLASGVPQHFEEYVANLGMWIAAEVLPDLHPGHLAVLFTNVSARRQTEQALQESVARQAYLLALSDQLRPLVDAGEIQAVAARLLGEYLQANQVHYGETQGEYVLMQRGYGNGLPPMVGRFRALDFGEKLTATHRARQVQVVADIEANPDSTEAERAVLRQAGIGAYITVPLLKAGEWVATLAVHSRAPRPWTTSEVQVVEEVAERTWAAVERARAEEALRRSEVEFRSLVTATSDTVYKMSADWQQMHHLLGKNFLADTPSSSGTWLEHYIPVADQPLVHAAIEAAIRAKAIFELEHRVIQADGRVGWVHSRAMPVLNAQGTITEWLGAAQDVTARKQAEAQLRDFNARLEQQVAERTHALQQSRDLLHAVAESQTVTLSAFTAVRNARHQLVELACTFANSRAAQQAGGRPVVGQPYLYQLPAAERARLVAAYRRIIDTGLTEEREFMRPQPQPGWFRTIVTKLGDGVLVSEEDITLRKQAEQERTKTLQLLEQAEEVAEMGSWDYELATKTLTWSAGMYRLFNLAPTDAVVPGRYREAAVPEDQLIVEHLERYLAAGTGAFDETLRLQVGSQVKTVRVKGVALEGKLGEAGRVLGVDLDISDVRRLEAENLALRLDQQKALLLAILHAQETERNRIAESLHNGLGQMLYAIKLQVSQLDVPALHALPELNGVRHHVNHLLSDAIHQTRTLAHELLPAALTEQGLGPALRDICRGLSTPQLRFTCHVWPAEQVLAPSLQTALYRLAQELMLNIAKHSGASQATLEFELLPGWVSLRAEDNGHGFDTATTAWGLGLRLLHEAVELLGGTVLLNSSPEYGTHIRLRIPLA